MEITENITNIGALKAFIADLPDDLEIDIDSVGKTGFVCGPVTMTKYVWDVDGKKTYDFYLNIPAESGYHY